MGLILLSALACSNHGSARGLEGKYGADDSSSGSDDVPVDDTGEAVGDDSGGGGDDSGFQALDDDEDGYPSSIDCDDSDPDSYPGAVDPVGDGVDQDCNGYDGPPLPGIETLQVGDLVVTEIMIHPLGVDDSVGEWFEIANVSGNGFDLDGLQIFDDGSDTFWIDEPTALLPGRTMVFGIDASTATNGGVDVDYEYGNFTLDDKSDAIALSNGTIVLDRAPYTVTGDSTWSEAATRSLDPGHFDERSNDDDRAWCAATSTFGGGELGTPGAANDDCPALSVENLYLGEIVIDEVMTDPSAADATDGQWFEIYNASVFSVNLEGLVVRVDGEAYHVTSALEVVPGSLTVLGTDADVTVNGGVIVDFEWPAGPTYQLSVGDGDLAIENDSLVLDWIAWRTDNGFPTTTGASMSLDPAHQSALDNDDGTNWCASTMAFGDGDYGTPGAPNGC